MTMSKDTQHDSGPVPGFAASFALGAVASVVWLAAVAAYVWAGIGAPGVVTMGLAVVVPLALIWAAVATLRQMRALRAEAASLQATIAGLRADQARAARPVEETVKVTFASRRDAVGVLPPPAAPEPVPEAEPLLALDTPPEPEHAPLSVPDFIRALQFPSDADDHEGFRALRLALQDRTTAKLIRAAQDVLTLLSQEGIYMDDLTPDRARPDVWRRFAAGERGRTVAALGGVRDRSSLALTASRMREDTVFRDAGHHFLRSFDKAFSAFEPLASDEELADLAETRTARAFMLFGRVTGTFD